jgi:hypothetical protein
MTRDEWLRRYRERHRQRRPHMTRQQLDDVEAYETLSVDYPNDPEAAADVELSNSKDDDDPARSH